MEPPLRKPLSYRNFKIIFTSYIHTLITIIFQQKKNWKFLYGFKMAAKKRIFANSHVTKNLKNHFPKGFFQWNLAQIRRLCIHLHCCNKILNQKFCGVKMAQPKNKMLGIMEPPLMQLSVKAINIYENNNSNYQWQHHTFHSPRGQL